MRMIDAVVRIPANPHPGESIGAIMPSTSKIKPILGHLAWWESALRDTARPETPYRKALLVFNAATLLEWHVSIPDKASVDEIPNANDRNKSAKTVRGFVSAAHKCVVKTESDSGKKAEKRVGTLADDTATFLKQLSKIFGREVTPARKLQFERPISIATLLTAWLEANTAAQATPSPKTKPARDYELSCQYGINALAPAIAAQQRFEAGTMTAAAYTAVRQTCAKHLDEVIDHATGSAAQRLRQKGKPVIKAFRLPVTPRAGKREA